MVEETKTKPSRTRRATGSYGMTIEEAGAMVGLSRASSFRAAHKGQIPTLRLGKNLLVPRLVWLRMLGEIAPKPTRQTAAEAPAETADANA
jgi:hypothetical protein